MGLRISAGNDLMFSSLPCARNTPFRLMLESASCQRTVSTLIVRWLHLNNQSSDSLNSSGEMASFFFSFDFVLLANR